MAEADAVAVHLQPCEGEQSMRLLGPRKIEPAIVGEYSVQRRPHQGIAHYRTAIPLLGQRAELLRELYEYAVAAATEPAFDIVKDLLHPAEGFVIHSALQFGKFPSAGRL